MAQLLKQGLAPSEVMESIAALDAKRGPYKPCPCGSGKNFRFCHGNALPRAPIGDATKANPAAPEKRVTSLQTELSGDRAPVSIN
jgi:uncharacterized protein